MTHQLTVEVYWARDAQDAHQVAGLLESEGIEAVVVGELLQAAAYELAVGPASAPRVRVGAPDEQRALAAIAAWERSRGDDVEDWACGKCGELVEGNFEICWNCQAPRDGASPGC